MDSLPDTQSIKESLPKTFAIYAPLLLANSTQILSTPCTTHRYGPNEHQELDIYQPPSVKETSPVLVWMYGGGFINGDRILSTNQGLYAGGLVYANVAHFFAKNFGFVVVVVDYRLIRHGAVYPSGGEDLGLALVWLSKHFRSRKEIYIIGNSAGGVHLATWMFAPELTGLRSAIPSLTVKAVILLSVPFDMMEAAPQRAEVNEKYWGPPDQVREKVPSGLLKSAGPSAFGHRVLIMNGTKDPEDEILGPLQRFLDAARKLHMNVENMMMVGHNHISPFLSLGTGIAKEEEWGFIAGRWMLAADTDSVHCKSEANSSSSMENP